MSGVGPADPGSTPSIARIYDYVLGGSANFQAHRDAAQVLLDAFPGERDHAWINRAFLRPPRATSATRGRSSRRRASATCSTSTARSRLGPVRGDTLLEPGVVPSAAWRPDTPVTAEQAAGSNSWGVVGLKD